MISVIDNVANTNYKTSNGPTPSKKPRKQNLAALTSPSKEAMVYSNGNNSTPQDSKVKVLKLETSPTPVSSNAFTSPINLPIYVKRELIYPPERREQKTILPIPNSTTITSVMFSAPSTLSSSNMSVSKQADTNFSTSNGQTGTNSNNHYVPNQSPSPIAPLDITAENLPSKSFYQNRLWVLMWNYLIETV